MSDTEMGKNPKNTSTNDNKIKKKKKKKTKEKSHFLTFFGTQVPKILPHILTISMKNFSV